MTRSPSPALRIGLPLGLALILSALGGRPQAAPLNGSNTALGQVTNVQQSGVSPPAATLTSTSNGVGSDFVLTPNAARSLIDWSTFTLGSGNTLAFAFSARDDIALNRIASGSASINGALSSTVQGAYGGNVWFLAPGGVVFGANAVVNVGGLLATPSPLSMSDAAFLASTDTTNFTFGTASTGATVSAASGASVNGHGGLVALIAPVVATASGAAINADAGASQVLYGAAKAYEIQLSPSASNDLDLVGFVIDTPADGAAPLSLAGATTAGSAYVAGAASTVNALISLPGNIAATQAASVGGDIVLSAGGLASSSGAIKPTAASASTAGATITTTTGPMSADAGVILSAAGALSIGGATTAQSLDLETSGAVTQSAAVTAGTLTGSAGSVTFSQTGNQITTLGAFTTASGFNLTDGQALTVSGPLTSTGGNVALATTTGDLTLSGAVNVASRDLTLSAGNGGAISIGGAVTAEGLDLETSGAVTQSAAVTTALLVGDAGSLAFGQTGNRIGSLWVFTAASGFSLTDGEALTVIGPLSTGGATSLTAVVGGLTLSGTVNAAGQGLTLAAGHGGAIAIDGAVTAGRLDLETSGAVTQSAAVTAGTLTGNVGTLVFSQAGNQIGALGTFAAASGFNLTDGQALTVAGPVTSTGGAVSLTTTGALTLSGAVNASGQSLALTAGGPVSVGGAVSARSLDLETPGAVTQSAAVTAGTLTGTVGSLAFGQAGNQIGALGPFTAAAGFSLTDAQALTVSSPLTSTGGTTALTATGALTLSGTVNASGQSLALAAGGPIAIGAAITAQSLDLQATGAVTQSAAVTAGTLTGNVGGLAFGQAGNRIGVLGPFTAASGFSLTDGQALTVSGLTSIGGAAALTTTGALTLSGATNASGQNLTLMAGGPVSVGGAVTAQSLDLETSGPVTQSAAVTAGTLTGNVGNLAFSQTGNQIDDLGPFTATSGFNLTDGRALAVSGPLTSTGGAASLTSAGALTLSGAVDAGGQALRLVADGPVAIGGAVTAENLDLEATGAVTQSAAVTAGTLTGNVGSLVFGQTGNQIGAVGPFTAASGFNLTDGLPLTVSGPLTSTGGAMSLTSAGALTLSGAVNAPGQSLLLTAGGPISLGGAVSAQSLDLETPGAATQGAAVTVGALTGNVGSLAFSEAANQIAALGAFTAASGFSLADAQALTVSGPLTSAGGATSLTTVGALTLSGAVNASGQSLVLTAGGPIAIGGAVTAQSLDLETAGAVTQSAAVTAGTLTGSVGSLAFGEAGNQIASLGTFAAASGFSLTDGQALTVSGPLASTGGATALTSAGALTLSETVNVAGQSLTLIAGGPISIGATVTAQTLDLETPGAVTQSAAVSAGTLTGGAGSLAFGQAGNQVSTLGAFTAASGFSLTDGQALTVTGPLTGGTIALTTTGNLTLSGPVTAVTGVLASNQDIALDGAVATSGGLTVSAGGAISQAGAVSSGGTATYTAAGALILAGGSIQSGQNLALTAQGGPLEIVTEPSAPADFTNLTVKGALTLSAPTGSILIGEAPFVTAVADFLASNSAAFVNVSKNVPLVEQAPASGRIFIRTGTMDLAARVGVVQQNTILEPNLASGVELLNPGAVTYPLVIGGAPRGDPGVVDLFVSLVNKVGVTLTDKVVATSGAIDLMVASSNDYRVNGCVIGQAGVCAVLSDAILNIQPANLTGDLQLQSLPNDSQLDPTITGAGNEEIWRNRP